MGRTYLAVNGKGVAKLSTPAMISNSLWIVTVATINSNEYYNYEA